jgi:pilus assembly protein CpaB
MNRNRWLVVIAVALVMSIGLTYLIFRIVQKRLQPREETTKIVIATQKLSLGQRITEEDIRLGDWPLSIPIEGSFGDLETVIDRGVTSTIYPGDPITDARLAPREGGAGLPTVIPDGMRAVGVAVNNVISVAGFVLPGNRVDVIVTGTPPNGSGVVSRIFLENVEVLTAGQSVTQDVNGQPQNFSVVNLLVTPEQAQELVLAGRDSIQLSLRPALDTEEIDPEASKREELFVPQKKAKPKTAAVKSPVKPRPRPVVTPPLQPQPKPEIRVTSIEMIQGDTKKTLEFRERVPE